MTFKTDLTDDLTFFLNNEEFAVDVLYNAATIQGIFDDEFTSGAADGVGIETTVAQVLVKTSDVASAAQGETMTINSVDYNIIGIQPDGTGLTLILLSRN
jgi:hypothetical protein